MAFRVEAFVDIRPHAERLIVASFNQGGPNPSEAFDRFFAEWSACSPEVQRERLEAMLIALAFSTTALAMVREAFPPDPSSAVQETFDFIEQVGRASPLQRNVIVNETMQRLGDRLG